MPGSALAQVALDTRGQVKLNSTIAFPTHRGLFADIGSKPLHDFSLTTRLVNRLDMTPDTCLDVDLQTSAAFGDSLHRGQKLQNAEPVLFPEGLAAPMRDEARFMDLTAVRTSGDTVETYRLDRLAVTHLTRWGSITLGRQALTLGNGMAFNVMDLFNPFSPTDLDKDYKTGNDMAVLRAGLSPNADVQLIYVPRRNAATHQHDWDQDSLAAHLHLLGDMAEFDFMLAKHYRDTVTGVGIRSDMLGTAWRIDGTLTFLNARPGRDKVIHPALVANLDRSWMWAGHNCYGFAEYYFNGLSDNNAEQALNDPDMATRLARGELFVTGRHYLAGAFNIELHPLTRFLIGGMVNLQDRSGLVQPHISQSLTQNSDLNIGANLPFGPPGSEYGGRRIPGTSLYDEPSASLFAWISWYF